MISSEIEAWQTLAHGCFCYRQWHSGSLVHSHAKFGNAPGLAEKLGKWLSSLHSAAGGRITELY